jgi:hypothetical protein
MEIPETDPGVASTERPWPKLWQPQRPSLAILRALGNSTGARLPSTAARLPPGVKIGQTDGHPVRASHWDYIANE